MIFKCQVSYIKIKIGLNWRIQWARILFHIVKLYDVLLSFSLISILIFRHQNKDNRWLFTSHILINRTMILSLGDQNMNNFFWSIKNKNNILKVKINKYIKDQIGPYSILEIYKAKDTKLPFLIYFNLLIYNISKMFFWISKIIYD